MILAITRDNEKLIYEVCKENDFENPQVLTGVDSLKKFAVQELRNLNNYKQIIIDIASTKETENEIVQAVVAIKSMYNIKIIIVALGFQEGNSLLAKLFNEGIYNFVNASTYFEQKEQFRNCLSNEGCQYKDAVRFRQKLEEGKKNKVIIKKVEPTIINLDITLTLSKEADFTLLQDSIAKNIQAFFSSLEIGEAVALNKVVSLCFVSEHILNAEVAEFVSVSEDSIYELNKITIKKN